MGARHGLHWFTGPNGRAVKRMAQQEWGNDLMNIHHFVTVRDVRWRCFNTWGLETVLKNAINKKEMRLLDTSTASPRRNLFSDVPFSFSYRDE